MAKKIENGPWPEIGEKIENDPKSYFFAPFFKFCGQFFPFSAIGTLSLLYQLARLATPDVKLQILNLAGGR